MTRYRHFKIRSLHLLLVLLSCPLGLWAQNEPADTNYIKPFTRPNMVEVGTGVYSTSFSFSRRRDRNSNFRLSANSSHYLTGYFNYKWLSLQYSFNLPGTQLDRNVHLKYTSLKFRFGGRKFVFHPFYDSYNGLLVLDHKRDSFTAFRNIRLRDVGIDLLVFTNTRRFSIRAAHGFSERQVRSAGGLFLMITPMWQEINWTMPSHDLVPDSTTYSLLAAEPQWLSLIGRIGYAHNFVWKAGTWLVAPAVVLGSGALRELHTGKKTLQWITDVQAWMNAGYNGHRFYSYINLTWSNTRTNLFTSIMRQRHTDYSITAGCRLGNLRRKVLGLL